MIFIVRLGGGSLYFFAGDGDVGEVGAKASIYVLYFVQVQHRRDIGTSFG